MTFISISIAAIVFATLTVLALSTVAPDVAIKALGLAVILTIVLGMLRVNASRIALGVALGVLTMLVLEFALPRFAD